MIAALGLTQVPSAAEASQRIEETSCPQKPPAKTVRTSFCASFTCIFESCSEPCQQLSMDENPGLPPEASIWRGYSIGNLVALPRVLIHPRGQIQRNQRKACLPALGVLEPHNVLMALGAGLQLQAVVAASVILAIDLHVGAVPIVRAGQPL